MTSPNLKPLIVVMGVSACGKSTVGKLLAARLSLVYADGDDFHSRANIDKMRSGVPLNDADRRPWLDEIGHWLHEQTAGGVMSCSALKRAYRDRLRAAAPATVFLHLCGGVEVLRKRIAARRNHFMPASLLDSQLDTLEPLEPDEVGIAIDLRERPEQIVEQFLSYLAANSQHQPGQGRESY